MMRWLAIVPLCAIAAACTPGGVFPGSAGSSGGVPTSVTTIDVSIAAFGAQGTPGGTGLGFSPEVTNVAVGGGVRFMNVDNTSHTATAIPGATTFPAQSPFSFAATQPALLPITGSWSAGTMLPGASSAVFFIDQPGTYLFGCFFHYSGNMRGAIVAK
jgi:plastocyanin